MEEAIVFSYIRWIPLLPLIGFLINGLGARAELGPAGTQRVHWVACLAPFGSFLISVLAFTKLLGLPAEGRLLTDTVFTWIASGEFTANLTFSIDPLSSVMTLVVTGVGFLIHVYSIGYMHGDKGYSRYFAYLNLFTAMMLVLVLGDNLLLMFLGWEGVGLCSYFLIGFWYEDPEKAYAGLKAFVVNRIGDFGFLLGLFLLFWGLGQHGIWTIDFGSIQEHVHLLSPAIITAICLLLFMGAMGKSAQIPLYVWLPDAMAGPTPVSALIHAATMVTAGVYMVARMHFLFVASDLAMQWVAWTGAITALFAATIGICQNDIKKVLAYSTVSQLGYMFVGVGIGAYAAGIFHLMTHAFFKALLFLGAGSVMHAMGNETDIQKMGGLQKEDALDLLDLHRSHGGHLRHPALQRLLLQGRDPLAGLLVPPRVDRPLARALDRCRGHSFLHVQTGLPHLLRRTEGPSPARSRPRIPGGHDRAAGPARRGCGTRRFRGGTRVPGPYESL